jgi:gliding motility-associated-like protein
MPVQDITIVAGDVVQLNGFGTAGSAYQWSPSAGLSATNILNPMANPTNTTTYTLSVTHPLGCVATDDILVTVLPYCVKPMEAFTPNGDGINDFWKITDGNCIRSAKVGVFNRYGSPVYESDNYRDNWDGTYKGKPVPDGTYYFQISYQLANGKTVFQKGNVTILR